LSPNAHEDGWELGGALRETLEGMPLRPRPAREGRLARLGPLVEEALAELGRLERQRGLSDGELAQKESLEGLLDASRADGPDG
jgi:hypothetical protein